MASGERSRQRYEWLDSYRLSCCYNTYRFFTLRFVAYISLCYTPLFSIKLWLKDEQSKLTKICNGIKWMNEKEIYYRNLMSLVLFFLINWLPALYRSGYNRTVELFSLSLIFSSAWLNESAEYWESQFFLHTSSIEEDHRRRIKSEEKAVVASVWGGKIYSIPCRARCFT